MRDIRIEVVVGLVEDSASVPVGCPPIDEVRALVELAGRGTGVLGAEVASLVTALALLEFPPRYVCVDEHVGVRANEGRPGADDEDETSRCPSHFIAQPLDEP